MDRLRSIYRLALKELASSSRDVALVGLIVYAFTYAVYGPAKGARMELRYASVAIIDEDRSVLSARLGDALLPPLFQAPRYLGRAEIDSAMDSGRFTFIVDIPPRFEADIQAGREPALQVSIDATAMSQAGRGASYINAIFASEIEWLQQIIQISPTAHFVNSALAILYRGANFGSVVNEIAITAGLGVLFFAVALGRFRKMIAIAQLRGV